jgi:hypothetical protein
LLLGIPDAAMLAGLIIPVGLHVGVVSTSGRRSTANMARKASSLADHPAGKV